MRKSAVSAIPPYRFSYQMLFSKPRRFVLPKNCFYKKTL